jgi:hypothetical protein
MTGGMAAPVCGLSGVRFTLACWRNRGRGFSFSVALIRSSYRDPDPAVVPFEGLTALKAMCRYIRPYIGRPMADCLQANWARE